MKGLEAAIPGVQSIELDNAFFVEDGVWIESYTVSATTEVDTEAVVDEIDGLTLLDSRDIPTGPSSKTTFRLIVSAREPYPFVLGVVLRHGAVPNRVILLATEFEVVVTVRDWESIRMLADEVTEMFGKFDLESVKEIEYIGEPLDTGRLSEVVVAKLTDEQLEILETAYTRGYFSVPRETSADDIAEELDIATSTFSERLRVAQQRLLALVYGGEIQDDSPDHERSVQ